jgi:hypothetical protein
MINSYFRPSAVRPSTALTNYNTRITQERTNTASKNRKYKLLILLLTKSLKRNLKNMWEQLW